MEDEMLSYEQKVEFVMYIEAVLKKKLTIDYLRLGLVSD